MPESRPRRAARSRKVVVEEVEEEEDHEEEEPSEEEEETPPPSPRKRKTPKKPAAEKPAQAAIRTRTGKRTSRALSEVEPPTPKAPAKAGRPRKQRKTSLEAAPEETEKEEAPANATLHLQTPRPTPGDSVRTSPGSGDKRKADVLREETPRRSKSVEVETPKAPLATSTPAPRTNNMPPPAFKDKSRTPSEKPEDMLSQVHEVKPNATPKASQSSQKVSMSQAEIAIRQRSYAMPEQAIEPEVPKQRMVISNLILVNFKSYAGRQEVGPFHVSFSSVVGPNGSGKSNVIDSLLFVFGFRASKMRQGKVSDLIHNSGTFRNLDHCEVQVHFKEIIDLPGGGFEDIPGSELIVSRKAFKNNSSQYYINGKTSNHGTVTTLLREKGIDLDHKRFLILQGEVESIAQMKPKAQGDNDDGLLEYLEDIIGTTKYKQPIEDGVKEAEELNEVCAQKLHRVTLVEKEKDGLEDKKNIALKYIRDENELAEKQSMLYQVYMHECENIVNLTSENIAQMQLQLDEEMTKHRGNEDGMKALKKKYDAIITEQEALEKDVSVLAKEMSKYDKENVKLQEKQKFLTGKQKKSEKTQSSSRLSASEAANAIEQSTADIEKYGGEVKELEERLVVEEKALADIREELKDKTAGLSEQISAKQKSLEPFNARISQKQSAIAVAKSELDIINEKRNASAVALEEIKAKIVSIRDNGRAKESEFEEKKSELDQLEKDGAELEKRLNSLTNKEPEIRNAVSSARQKAEEARASLSASQNQGSVLSGLMRLKESGRIEGFHGRLGNLGTIDAKFDVAISTACPQLDNMVVDSVEIGQQCIEYLRKNNLGRAMFICLDRLPRRDLSAIDTPENVPRLFDLVKCSDPKFAPAFYSVLQNTLVAKDMPHANRIAYGAKRWRVVTLDGQLIDKSGTMTGGGTRVNRGGMSSKFAAQTSKEQVVKLEAERDAQEQALQQYQKKRQDFETALRDVNNQIPRLRTEISKIELEIQSTLKNMEDAKQRRKEIEQETGPSKADDDQAKKLEKKIAGLEAEIEEIRSEMADIEAEIQELQDKVMQIGGIRLRGQKAKVDGIREQIDTLNEQINAAEVAKVKAEKNKIKFEKQFAQSEKELEAVAEELSQLEETIKEQALARDESRSQLKEVENYLETKKDEAAAAKEELDEKEAELNKIRAMEIEMRNRLEEQTKSLIDNQKKQAYWQEKLGKLTLHPLDDLIGTKRAGKPKKVQKPKKTKTVIETDEDGEEMEIEVEIEDEEDEVEEEEEKKEDEENEDEEEEEEEDESQPSLTEYTEDELAEMDKDSLKADIALLEERIQNVSVDLSVLQEYRRRVEEHAARKMDLDEAVGNRDSVKQRVDELRKRRVTEFQEGFNQISMRLKEMYQMITMGGNAELEFVDSLDPFSEGINFSVMPPKKSWKNISNLSGGEKTLSSLALVFALHHYKPTPLYVMDEIDAALDFRNVSIVASYIKERTKNAQFIVISLRNNMFELAARLVGVYKVNHMTKSVAINNDDYINRK